MTDDFQIPTSNYLHAITRLTLLFDVAQSFSSTLQTKELAQAICNRTANVMDAKSCALWLVEKPNMVCREVYGHYRADLPGKKETDAGTIVGDVLRGNEPLILSDDKDPRIVARLKDLDGAGIASLICAPVKHDGQWMGALEIIRHSDSAFSEDDAFLLAEIAGQAARSLRNAQRHEAESKVKELQSLLRISKEITSTLDLDRILTVVVNQLATLIPLDRCAIALNNRGRFQIAAIAGESEVRQKDPKVKALAEMMDWAGQAGTEMYLSEVDGHINSDRTETREKLRAHFAENGTRSFFSTPLSDEEGALGVLVLESKVPNFLTASHLEVLKIFVGQATVALRNAQLYRAVPLIGALSPLVTKKKQFLALGRTKRVAIIAAAILIPAILIFFPWNLKVGGSAYVMPTRSAKVNAEVEGIIAETRVREGDFVRRGDVVATLRGDEYLLNLNDARARYDIISKEILRAQAVAGAAMAQMERVKLDQTEREIKVYESRLGQTQIRAPIDGVVVTPRTEEKVGRFIQRGEAFCETADVDPIVVELLVPEDDIGLVSIGQDVWLKANAFPSEKFIGRVSHISAEARDEQGSRMFVVRADVSNPARSLRTGMVGRAKVLTGNRSVGYVLFRSPIRWLRTKVWQWMP